MEEFSIEKYLNEGEKILWKGKAKDNESILCSFINVFPFLLIWLAAEVLILSYSVYYKIFGEFNVYYLLMTIAAIVLHLVPTVVWIIGAIKENERLRGKEYYITDSRIIIINSLTHYSVDIINKAEADEAFLKRSFAELILGSGKIVIEAGEEKIIFYSIEEAQKSFKKAYRALFKDVAVKSAEVDSED